MKQPAVNTVVENDIYRLNGLPAARYGVFAWTQGLHRVDLLSGLTTLKFFLFYVDRVDTGDANEVAAQSDALDVLTNVVRTVANKYELDVPGELVFQPFKERFKDDCAGQYVEVEFQTDAYVACEDDF